MNDKLDPNLRRAPSNLELERLNITETRFGTPVISGDTMEIPVKNLNLLPSHPLNCTGESEWIHSGVIRVFGLVSSKREIIEYVGDPREGNVKPLVEVEEFPETPASVPVNGDTVVLDMEGWMEVPYSQIPNWLIVCSRAELEIDAEPPSKLPGLFLPGG